MQNQFDRSALPPKADRPSSEATPHFDQGLKKLIQRLSHNLERDALVQKTTNEVREQLQVDRVALYYFYREWKGRVTFEALSDRKYSIYGETGPDECFNWEYAQLYLQGRVRSIPDIDAEPIADCHRDFLKGMQVRANLVVPILIPPPQASTDSEPNNSVRLWGLLVAHHCQDVKDWTEANVQTMQQGAETLATSPVIVKTDRTNVPPIN
ncbi:GAF domain-containing protein [Leptolyngbya ohadii]|uniref:GAF domain-containing protein n=1 Tax=Leptolyngbya ohadii TaxID=1962290 RepID=UPI0021F1964A|nr:GAF domain-containing protein [Leptolyngbya ohadii]